MKCVTLLFPIIVFPLFLHGQDFPLKPSSFVTDFDPFYSGRRALKQNETELLNAKLRAFEDSTGVRLLIFLTSMRPINTEAYAQEVFDAWRVEQTSGGKGILLCIFTAEPKFTLHVSRRLENDWPNDVCVEMLEREMMPYLIDGHFYSGINAGIDQLAHYDQYGYESPGLLEQMKEKIPATIGIAALTLPFLVGLFFRFMRRNRSKG